MSAIADNPALLTAIRERFAHVSHCPFEGERVFFENAGGALHLKTVVETSAFHASLPDNQNRDNPASKALMAIIAQGRADMALFFKANSGKLFVGESGSEVLFRLIRTAALGAEPGGVMLASTLEHPASRGAMTRWAALTDRTLIEVPHDDASGSVDVAAFQARLRPDIRVASLVHTSPVTGMAVDVPAIAAAIRAVAPQAFVIVDGIQHASHGAVDVQACSADGYAISPYKVFSRHGYGVGWASDRLSALPQEHIHNALAPNWELGTRDSGAYATFSDVVAYLQWLGGEVSPAHTPRAKLEAAAQAIGDYERGLMAAMLNGVGNQAGLCDLPGVTVIGGNRVQGREGVVSLRMASRASADLVAHLRARGIRTHIRKCDHYSGNVLAPLGWPDCVRVSASHYNSLEEVGRFLAAMRDAADGQG